MAKYEMTEEDQIKSMQEVDLQEWGDGVMGRWGDGVIRHFIAD